MKTKNMYLNRLLRLGRHIGKNHLNEILFAKSKNYRAKKGGCSVEHFDWALAELPRIENKHWMRGEEGFPCLASNSKLNTLTGVAVFYNLTGDELFHLFVPGYQDPLYMGTPLGENASPSDLANNIYQFVSMKEDESSNRGNVVSIKHIKEKKVLKKLNYKNAA